MGKTKPLLKWAGGKSKLLPELLKRLPESFDTYHEPFVGGGALWFALLPEKSYLSDVNFHLINFYQQVAKNPKTLVTLNQCHFNTPEYYEEIRALGKPEKQYHMNLSLSASRFLYLNKTCYRGLYRENQSGEFNVPYGNYKNPDWVMADQIWEASKLLKKARIHCRSFTSSVIDMKRNDFVFYDPPYVPTSATANFTTYNKKGFGLLQQQMLKRVCKDLSERGVKFMVTNSNCDFIKDLWKDFYIEEVASDHSINNRKTTRPKTTEVIIRNYGRPTKIRANRKKPTPAKSFMATAAT